MIVMYERQTKNQFVFGIKDEGGFGRSTKKQTKLGDGFGD